MDSKWKVNPNLVQRNRNRTYLRKKSVIRLYDLEFLVFLKNNNPFLKLRKLLKHVVIAAGDIFP